MKPTKGRINQVLGHILVIALKQSTLYFIQTRKKRWSIEKCWLDQKGTRLAIKKVQAHASPDF